MNACAQNACALQAPPTPVWACIAAMGCDRKMSARNFFKKVCHDFPLISDFAG